MGLNPDIQKYLDYKYVEGELHIFIRKEMVDELGWSEQDLDMSFGGIRKMNNWGENVSLSFHRIPRTEYEHPWNTHMDETDSKSAHRGRQRDMDAL